MEQTRGLGQIAREHLSKQTNVFSGGCLTPTEAAKADLFSKGRIKETPCVEYVLVLFVFEDLEYIIITLDID